MGQGGARLTLIFNLEAVLDMVELADIVLGEVVGALDHHQVRAAEGFIAEQVTPVVDLDVELVYSLSCNNV